jgi:transposase
MRSVAPLTETDKKQLTVLFKHHNSHSVRRRAQSILLSAAGFTINEIVRIHQIHRDTVRATFDKWEKKGIDGLFDGAKSGRPPKLSPDEAEEAVKLLKKDPRSTKNALTNTKKKRAKKSVSGH